MTSAGSSPVTRDRTVQARLQRIAEKYDLAVMKSPPDVIDFGDTLNGLALASSILDRAMRNRVGEADSLEWHRLNEAADAIDSAIEFVTEWNAWDRSNP